MDAGEAAWNMRLISNRPSFGPFEDAWNSDLAFMGNFVFQGNYNGFIVWDASDPENPTLETSYLCPASQSDVSIFRNLLFVSGESLGGRVDCGTQGVEEAVSPDRLRGIRIFDISDVTAPRYIANVHTCRGSHTHTVMTDPRDDSNVYVYVSGSASVRPPEELEGCSDLTPGGGPQLLALQDRGDPGSSRCARERAHCELAENLHGSRHRAAPRRGDFALVGQREVTRCSGFGRAQISVTTSPPTRRWGSPEEPVRATACCSM